MVVWMPFTQMKLVSNPPKVVKANGVWLYLEDGRKLMDCISSWWVILHGHGSEEIAEAVYKQALNLEHVIFAGITHQPAEEFAEKLISFLPDNLSKVFYSDDGSTSVEVALKMAVQYWKNKGINRDRFISFEGAYHGDTVGSMSVSSRSIFTESFNKMLFDVDFLPFPSTYLNDPDFLEKEEQTLKVLDDYLSIYGNRYAGLIIEPLIQGAVGMKMCRPEFLSSLESCVKKYEILIIYDEVMVGFGRTGDFFACLKSKTKPDIICLSKGITGGFMPLGATVCTEKIFESFYSNDTAKTFYHGHSYTANPLGCAAGLASLKFLEKNKDLFVNMEKMHLKYINTFEKHPLIKNLRVCGTIAAMDVIIGKDNYANKIGLFLREEFLKQGFLLRPLGNVIYILPPYCIKEDELESIYACIKKVVDGLS